MISLVRIDDRLLHGQVAYGWTSSLGVNVILVVNDEAKNDQMKAMALNLAKPNQVKLYIRGVEESGEIVRKFAEAKKSKVLVLVKNSADALSLAQGSGGAIHSVNVGGMRYSEGKLKLTDLVAVDQQDLENFKKMQELGVELEFRLLPRDKKKTLSDLLKN
ncbi:PTS sugar transporter subunit IIB [Weizmannia coagulans]|uniref:PTS system sorbose subfamily IIB component n=3 Tax=Heyndrickxia TaxID=2837504 RepID=G2TQW8_HEYCO|nr:MULTISPECIES: PTS sugar transporter subunit IIB [Heyndrickxia]NWN95268.1 PTS sugar transporter subunit IIB [Bacillus sp. (in: firmicutes)]AEP00044.1 PTS system sorbose subfamily IIB component [Heyndrickxia coagulans 36D1]AKN54151.1 PTS system, mannose-specific IIB component [Heyndrickxia coagulans]APB38246.1 PTS mannose transporter subunit IIA [Heyndrickxia coagulans]ATW84227.1 PTS mannose/fructose/sorbose transporter subunit IIB [Heyndrickxia coagulans]